MTLVDLCHPMKVDMHGPGRPPHQNMSLHWTRTLEKDGMQCVSVSLGTHMGTHVDGPAHIIPGGATIDEMPLELFYGPGVVLDTTKGDNEPITISDLQAAQPAIEPGDIVLLRTGWADRLGTDEYGNDHPYVEPEAAEWLVEAGTKMIGVDMLSPDLPYSLKQPGFKYTTLAVFLRAGVPILLNLRNLESLVGMRVEVFALPLPIEGVDSGPSRVVARAL